MGGEGRPRWTDDRLDDFAGRLEDIANTQIALARVPERVGRLDERTLAMLKVQDETRKDIAHLREMVGRRFDDVDTAHELAGVQLAKAAAPPSLRDSFMAALPLIVSILVAVIGAIGVVVAANASG